MGWFVNGRVNPVRSYTGVIDFTVEHQKRTSEGKYQLGALIAKVEKLDREMEEVGKIKIKMISIIEGRAKFIDMRKKSCNYVDLPKLI